MPRAAAAMLDRCDSEIDLGIRALGKGDVGGRILQEHLPAERLLHLVDVIGHTGERLHRVGQRQEVVEEHRAVRRPGQVLGEQCGLVALDEMVQPLQVIPIERPIGADRQADAVQRERITVTDLREIAVRRAARSHVVLGVNLEKADGGLRVDDRAIVPGLEPYASARCDGAAAEAVGLKGHDDLRRLRLPGRAAAAPVPASRIGSGLGCQASGAARRLDGRARPLRQELESVGNRLCWSRRRSYPPRPGSRSGP